MKNEVEVFTQDCKKDWYTIEGLAELLGFESGYSMQSNPNILEVLNGFSSSNNVKMSGYHNTGKHYSENVLKALKQEAPLNELSLGFKTDTRLGGYHNTKRFCSSGILKAISAKGSGLKKNN